MYKANANELAKTYFDQPQTVENKQGLPFTVKETSGTVRDKVIVTTTTPPGQNTGVAHEQALVRIGHNLSHKSQQGLVVGFGLWKGHTDVVASFRDRSSSQNRKAIEFHPDFCDQYLSEAYKQNHPEQAKMMALQRTRSLPQELGDQLLKALLEQLPLEPDQVRNLSVDLRVRKMCNPLHEAAGAGMLDKVKHYVEVNANVNELATEDKCTPILAAAKNNQQEVVHYLLEQPGIDLTRHDGDHNLVIDYLKPNQQNFAQAVKILAQQDISWVLDRAVNGDVQYFKQTLHAVGLELLNIFNSEDLEIKVLLGKLKDPYHANLVTRLFYNETKENVISNQFERVLTTLERDMFDTSVNILMVEETLHGIRDYETKNPAVELEQRLGELKSQLDHYQRAIGKFKPLMSDKTPRLKHMCQDNIKRFNQLNKDYSSLVDHSANATHEASMPPPKARG